MTALYRDFATLEALDAQYDVDGIHPDFEGVGRTFDAASARALDTLESRLGARFGPTLDEHVDVFPAGGPGGARPVFVFIHGGYWRAASSRDNALAAVGPVAAGIDVVITNYSLAPKVSIDEITRQSRAAVAWVAEHAVEWGGDPERIVVGGHSAGAHQAAMVLGTAWDAEYGLPTDLVKAGLLISGLFDLRPLPYTSIAPALQLTHRTILAQSPQLLDAPAVGPVTVAWGAEETAEFRRQSADYHDKLRAAGVDAEAIELAGADHFESMLGLGRPGSPLVAAVARLAGATGRRRDR